MTNPLKRLIGGTRALESRLTTAFEQAAHTLTAPGAPPPLEVIDLAVEEIASHVQPIGRGRYAFPFTHVTITFVAATPEAQAAFEAICDGPPSLHERVTRRLVSRGGDQPDVQVDVMFTSAPDEGWPRPEFHVALARVPHAAPHAPAAPASASSPAPAAAPEPPPVRISILVTHGTADRGAYTFTALPIAIGRGADVRDHRNQLLRVNHVAFTEGDGDVNQTVSRRHARIELDPQTGRPRVIDDNSAQGTTVIRQGKGTPVPRGSRGLGLKDGDEIAVGAGRLRVRIDFSAG